MVNKLKATEDFFLLLTSLKYIFILLKNVKFGCTGGADVILWDLDRT